MFNRFESNVKTTIAFLKMLNVKVTNTTVDETLQKHPDWPSLLCISDSLFKWDLPNAAGKIDVSEIDQLPTPFIAYTKGIENPLEIITKVSDSEIQLYSTKKQRIISANKTDFLKRWDGVYLIVEKNEKSGEKDFEKNKRNSFIKSLIPSSLILLITIISLLILQKNIKVSEYIYFIPIYLQFIVLYVGIVISVLLLWYEIDSSNPLLHKVCTGIVKGNCDAILSGKQSKIFSWLSWSEIGFFYFIGGLLTLLFSGPLTNSIAIISYLNILALPYTVFSIYYQGRVAKQWCVLCLSVQALLILGGANVIINGFLLPIQELQISVIIISILLYLIPVLLWYILKPHLLKLQDSKNTKREYLRIKFNIEIFETLLKKQKQITVSTDQLGIDLGNPDATNTLIKVCSPYCKHCSSSHTYIEKLLDNIPNLKVKIIFTTSNNKSLRAFNPVAHLLALADENSNQNIIKNALNDWYFSDKKDFEKFQAKHPIAKITKHQTDKIENMFNWCEITNIKYTPTFFFNGSQLPEVYNIEDLLYFLSE